ncbi:hypothetical protein, partial [Allokutzneria sp. NRRL B-24872]|uniref:hypothetical protein n=1 Tax=Allokutzneria sp. NRRL B-24872 TaxID=1137961 RepID=UPI001AF00F0C
VHAAAAAGRDLTHTALADDPARCLEVIAEHANEESWMLTTHQRMVDEVATFNQREHPEDSMGPGCDLYVAAIEGDVRRTARMVLRLLGDQVGPDATLGPLEGLLNSHSDHPACALLLSCINRNWRNAVAHAQFRWDPIAQRVSLSGELVEPATLASAAIRAHSVCTGFHAGVAVALNRAGNPHRRHAPPTDIVAWDGQVLRKLGKLGIEVTRLQHHGTTVRLSVPPLTIANFRDHLLGVFVAADGVPQAVNWEIKQDGRPSIVLDEKTIAAAHTVAETGADDLRRVNSHAVELILYAGALLNFGEKPQAVAKAVMALACSIVLGERARLRLLLLAEGSAALKSLSATLKCVIRGTRAAASLMNRSERLRVRAFAELLSTQCRHIRNSGREAASGLRDVEHELRSTAPIVLPWIASTHTVPS